MGFGHGYRSLVGVLLPSLHWNLAWCFLVRWELVTREKTFMSGPAHWPLCPASGMHAVFSKKNLPFTSNCQTGTAEACILWESLEQCWSITHKWVIKSTFCCFCCFVCWLVCFALFCFDGRLYLAVGWNIVDPDEKIYLNYISTFMHISRFCLFV